MDNESYFFVFWHMQLYMTWYIRSFFGFTFLNILYFFKYSCTNIFHRRSRYTFYFYDSRKISLSICIYFIQCLINVILTYDFIWIFILSMSLESPFCSYHSSHKHYLYRFVYVLCIAILPLFMLRIYQFMYWKSGTSDLLVLKLFVFQCTDYK